ETTRAVDVAGIRADVVAVSLPAHASIGDDMPSTDALRKRLRSVIALSDGGKRKPRTRCGVSFCITTRCLEDQAVASTGSTAEAWAPLGPCVTSNFTRWPSCRLRKPLLVMAEKWTNASAPPSSGAMKPKPLASLNHLTVPKLIA